MTPTPATPPIPSTPTPPTDPNATLQTPTQIDPDSFEARLDKAFRDNPNTRQFATNEDLGRQAEVDPDPNNASTVAGVEDGGEGVGSAPTPSPAPPAPAPGIPQESAVSPQAPAPAVDQPTGTQPAPPITPAPEDTPLQPAQTTVPEFTDYTYPILDPATSEIKTKSLTAEEMRKATGVYEWAEKLAPEQLNTIDAALSGQYVLIPQQDLPGIQQAVQYYQSVRGQYQQGQTPAVPPTATPPQPTPTAPTPAPPYNPNQPPVNPLIPTGAPIPPAPTQVQTPPPNFDEFADPEMAKQMWVLQNQVNQLTGQLTAQQQQAQLSQQEIEQQQFQQQFEAQVRPHVTAGENRFKTQFNLNDEQLERLRGQAINSGMFDRFAAQYQDYNEATYKILEWAAWQHEDTRRQLVQAQVTTATDDALTTHQQQQLRTQQAAALVNSNGTTPPPTPNNGNMTPEQREAGMVAAIAKARQEGLI